MQIALVIKPYDIEVFFVTDDVYTSMGTHPIERLGDEKTDTYEKRMLFALKELSTNIRGHDSFKKNAKLCTSIDIILCAPWCSYESMRIEKQFDQPTKITENMIQDLRVVKQIPDVEVVESEVFQILLNGYPVSRIQGQSVVSVDVQYLAVYGRVSFIQQIRKITESIFHTHHIRISSIYTHVQKEVSRTVLPTKNEIRVILEEESIDISFFSGGTHLLSFFVPYSYTHIQDEFCTLLATNSGTISEVLVSRTLATQNLSPLVNKNAKHLWPDLDANTKKIIDHTMAGCIETILTHIRNCIDSIDLTQYTEPVSVCIYGMHTKIISAYGYELAQKIVEDGYIQSKVHVSLDTVFVKKIF